MNENIKKRIMEKVETVIERVEFIEEHLLRGIVRDSLLRMQNISWVEEPLFGTAEKGSNITVPAKKLIVVKESKGDGNGNKNKKVTERRVVLYFYVKEKPFYLG